MLALLSTAVCNAPDFVLLRICHLETMIRIMKEERAIVDKNDNENGGAAGSMGEKIAKQKRLVGWFKRAHLFYMAVGQGCAMPSSLRRRKHRREETLTL